jgi:lipid-binding SYLF domain-containing protein
MRIAVRQPALNSYCKTPASKGLACHGIHKMTRSNMDKVRRHRQSSTGCWLTALLLAATGVPACADTTRSDSVPRDASQLSRLGEQLCADSPPHVPPQARERADEVLEQVYALPDDEKRYFMDRRRNAVGFAIFPNVQRQGFMVASLYGRGILSYRDDDGGWSPPILLTIRGQSMGPQFGAQSSNVIVIFRTVSGIKDILSGHHHITTLLSGAAVEHVEHAADPLGITVHFFDRGGMFGQSSDTYAIHIDEEANAALYGATLKPGCVVEGLRGGFKAPWMLRYFKNMQLPPGQAHRVLELE